MTLVLLFIVNLLYFSADKTLDKLNQHYVWVNNKGGCVYVISARIKTNCAVDDHIDAGDHVTCNITLGSWWYDDHNMDLEVSQKRTNLPTQAE